MTPYIMNVVYFKSYQFLVFGIKPLGSDMYICRHKIERLPNLEFSVKKIQKITFFLLGYGRVHK